MATPSHPQSASAPEEQQEGRVEQMVSRNFQLPERQAKWLRKESYEREVSQASLVREALDDLARKYESRR